jgi:osmotically inducible protein OsmC
MSVRKAQATWEGRLKEGTGHFHGEKGLAGTYDFSSRFADGPRSNPEELLAAAHASCFSMALAADLEKAGTPAHKVETEARVTLNRDNNGFVITEIDLIATVTGDGIDEAAMRAIADTTRRTCPLSKALAAVPTIRVEAKLARQPESAAV